MNTLHQAINMLFYLWIIHIGVFLYWRIFEVKYGFWSKPMDFGKCFFDGRRLFGAHKSIQGFLILIFIGTILGYFISTPVLGILYGLGHQLGSLLLSFAKRRLNVKQGGFFPILDQIDYIIGTYFIFLIFGVSVPLSTYIIAAIITIPVHVIGNIILFKLKVKDVPW